MNENSQSTAEPINRLIREFNRLPGIGPKSAQRIAFYLLRAAEENARDLADAVLSVKSQITLCSSCFIFPRRASRGPLPSIPFRSLRRLPIGSL